jgi:hypothetical protein
MLPDGLAPSNLHLRPSVKTQYVDGDMFDICERLAEIDPRLYIVQLHEDDEANYMIMEHCSDGVQRAVIPRGVKELDARVLEQVQYMLHVPFEHRLAAAEAQVEKADADHHEAVLDEMYDKMGGEFRRQLEHDGFITHRGVSYPKLGVAAPGRVR